MSCKKIGHQILVVDDYTPVGVLVECLSCRKSLHLTGQDVEENYTPFEHTSPKGPDGDIVILVHDHTLRGVWGIC